MSFGNFERRIAQLIEAERRPCPFCGRFLESKVVNWMDAGAAEPDTLVRVYWCAPITPSRK